MSNINFNSILAKAPVVMGIVNVTPDSFSDGGRYEATQQAIDHGLLLLNEGAQILDIGGESTRPNAKIVSIEDEIARVVPVIKALADAGAPYISIDTRNAATMRAALEAGANIINDVSALQHDPQSIVIAAQSGVPVCLMHMVGTPQTMQNAPHYDDVVQEVLDFFKVRMEYCLQHGMNKQQIILDVGIGFGKTPAHNLQLLKNIGKFKALGCPVLLGASRKSFIAAASKGEAAQDRLGGSLASVLWAAEQGVELFRVHDVAQTVQALAISRAIKEH